MKSQQLNTVEERHYARMISADIESAMNNMEYLQSHGVECEYDYDQLRSVKAAFDIAGFEP